MDYKDQIQSKRSAQNEQKKQEIIAKDINDISNVLKKPVEVEVNNINFDKLSEAILSIAKVQGQDGKDGYTPVKGKDYYTEKEIKDISDAIFKRVKIPKDGKDGRDGKDGKTPKKGIDYYTDSEVADIIEYIVKLIPVPQNGKDGKDGQDVILDYEQLVKDVVEKIPKPRNGINGRNGKDGKDGMSAYLVPASASTLGAVKIGSGITVDNNGVISATGGTGTSDHADLTNLDYASSGHTGFQPAGTYLTDIAGQDLSTADNSTSAFITAGDIPAIPTSVDDLSPSQTGNNGKFLKTDGTNATWESIPGGGDMLASVYDPAGGAEQVAFKSEIDNFQIQRIVATISTNTTAGATAKTDYIYLVTGTTTLTLPTAVGNTNRYTVKSISGTTVVACNGAETIDGTTTIEIANEDSVDLVSNNTEWKVI